jgi:hypothetical protein
MKVQRHIEYFIAIVAFLAVTPAVWADSYMGDYKGTFYPDSIR